jgi:hypothetical protein
MRSGQCTIIAVGAAALIGLATMAATAADTVSYAGTVSSVGGRSVVIRDMGPWAGTTEASVVSRTITVTPSTTFARAERAWDGTAAFPGDYAERPAARSDLTEGAFVAVECRPTGAGCQALKLTIVPTDQ